MEERQVQYRREGQQAILTLDRPHARNALSPQAIRELIAAVEQADADPQARVIVVTGAGDRAFCSGADLSGPIAATSELGGGLPEYARLLLAIQSAKKPSVARVNGHALAGGLGVMLACDLAVAAESAQLGTPEINVGLFPMMVMALLQRHLGRKRTLELVMTGERIGARQALALGLVNQVVPFADLDQAVAALASVLAGKSQATLAIGRRAFFAAEDMPLEAALQFLGAQLSQNMLLEDAAEGVAAFFEKRTAQWKDR